MKIILIVAVLFNCFAATAQNVGIGTDSPQSQLSVGSNSSFRVDSTGNLTRIKDVPYNFPATQGAAGQALTNNGSGGLNWSSVAVPYRGVIMCSAEDTAALIAKGYIIEGISESFTRFLSPAPGTWIPFAGVTSTLFGESMQNNPTVFTGTTVMVYTGSVFKINPTGTFWSVASANSVAGFGYPTSATAVWTGTEMIIYGGTNLGSPSNKGVKYNPTSNTWSAIANGPLKTGHSAVWTGTEMIVFGGDSCVGCVNPTTSSIWRYNPTSNIWVSPTPASGGPSRRSGHAAVWTGNQMVVFGGTNNGSTMFGGCFGYNPANGAWTTLNANAAADQVVFPKAVWTGTEILSWGNIDITQPYFLTTRVGTAYNPTTNSWSRFATEGSAPSMDGNANAVWTGTQMMLIRGKAYQKFSYTGTGKFVNVPTNVAYYMMRNNVPN